MKHWVSRLATALFCAAGLAGCGGGGGGSAAPTDSTTSAATAVKLSNVQPQTIDLKTVESEAPQQSVKLTGDVVGDLTRLSGQTLYALVEDPTGLLVVSSTQFMASGVSNSITLGLKSTLGRAGTLQGSLRVNVCLDALCAKPISGSPVTIPYQLSVAPGPKFLEGASMTVEVPFGTLTGASNEPLSAYTTPAAQRTLNVKLPDDLPTAPLYTQLNSNWTFNPDVPYDQAWAGLGSSVDINSSVPAGSTLPMSLTLAAKPVGTYKGRVKLRSIWKPDAVPPQYGEAVFDVTYSVKDSGKSVMFVPAAFDISSPLDIGGPTFFRVVGADGTVYSQVSRIVHGAESGGKSWLFLNSYSGDSGVFTLVRNNCDLGGCLLRGRKYTAQVFIATAAGKEADTPFMVSWTPQ